MTVANGNGNGWRGQLIHGMLAVIILMLGFLWQASTTRDSQVMTIIERIDSEGSRSLNSRFVGVDVRVAVLERQATIDAEWRRRLEEKIDMLVDEVRSLR